MRKEKLCVYRSNSLFIGMKEKQPKKDVFFLLRENCLADGLCKIDEK